MKKFHLYLLLLLCLCGAAFTSKTEFPVRLQQQLSLYYRYHAPLKIYVDFNQPKYSPGDTAFFKTYLLTPTGRLHTGGKYVINVMLVNAEQQGILRNKTFVQNGKGLSQLIFPANLPGGNYSLVAFIDGGESDKTSTPAYFQRSFVIAGEKLLKNEKNTTLQFFAEGGALIEGLPNTVAVTGMNASDEAYVNADGDKIVSFRATDRGWGKFSFTPEAGKQYTVEYKGNSFSLEAPKKDGVVMAVSGNDAEGLTASLQVREDFTMRDAELYLVMNVHDQICFATPVSFKRNTKMSVSLASKLCAYGTARLTLFTPDGNALAERIVFLEPSKPAIDIQFDKEQYRTREKVTADIRFSSADNALHTGNASVTVYRNDFFKDTDPGTSFFNHVFFDSDLSLPQALSNINYSSQEINDVLIAAKWNKITWQQLLAITPAIPKTSSALFLKGRLTNDQGKPAKDSTLITLWLNQNDFIYGVYTRNNGAFYFPLFKNFSDDQALYAVTYRNTTIKNAKLTIEEPSFVLGNTSIKMKSTENDAYHAFMKVKIPILKSFSYYEKKRSEGSEQRAMANEDVEEDYIDTDFTVELGKFKDFASVAEMLGEAVIMVKSKKVQGKDDIRVFINGTSMFASGSPLLVIDGVLTDSIDYLMAMNPSMIRSIGVIHEKNTLVRYGVLGKNGILVITTGAPEVHQEALRGKGTLNIKGIDSPLPFKKKKFQGESEKRIPDLRSVLHWEPGISVYATKETPVEFYTADGTGTYTVKVSGITEDGIPFETYRYFKVVR